MQPDQIHTRTQLHAALRDAAALEMSLMLQYIYAAYSIPNLVTGQAFVKAGIWNAELLQFMCGNGEERMDQGARGVILRIAREEMIHFLLANNLLIATGADFYVSTPDFSRVSRLYPGIQTEMALEPFSLPTVERFMHLEWPSYLQPLAEPKPGNLYHSVSELYQKIRDAFERHPEFITVTPGSTGGEHHLYLNQKMNTHHPDYQLQVDDLGSALFAIDFITEQGEGAHQQEESLEPSHFHRFQQIRDRLANIPEDWRQTLSYPCLRNPSTKTRPGTTKVEAEEALVVMEIFNACYEMSMQMMIQHFGLRPKSTLRKSYLMNASIDLMTGIMRTLGIALMSMPSGIAAYTAGPSFELPEKLGYMEDHEKLLQSMAKRFEDLERRARAIRGFPETATELLQHFSSYTLTLK